MERFCRNRGGAGIRILLVAGLWLSVGAAPAAEILLKDGRILKGRLSETFGLAELNNATDPDGGHIKQIVFVVDELRRTYVSKRQLQEVHPDSARQTDEKFQLLQPTPGGNSHVVSVGPPAKTVGNFDEFGRRNFTMQTGHGPLTVTQAITEITPHWVKVQGLNFLWDMRIATSTIPRDVLHKILVKQIDPKNIEQRKKIARFYIQSERYEEAQQALEEIIKDFPEQTDVKQQLDPIIRSLRQLAAERLLAELKSFRNGAGQHRLVQTLLKKFPTEDVSGEVLQAVREMVEQYDGLDTQRAEVLRDCDTLAAEIPDSTTRRSVEKVRETIAAEMNGDSLARMAAFQQNRSDSQLTAEEKLALAISGWLLGADNATAKLPAALSDQRLLALTRRYLSETTKVGRTRAFQSLTDEEGATPATVASLIGHMKPPGELPDPIDPEKPGYYRFQIVGLSKEPPVTYYVQLPPEYDPYRRYPVIVTLHGLGRTAEQQIDWWAGEWTPKGRRGQATRYGYIVVAPDWTAEHQKQYEFSAREHAAVLGCVRDACRRFAVNTDRVFLSGHSAGGDAAWDIGLAHPDLWAGVIPIAGESQRYCMMYWRNAQNLPFYVIEGELDGGRLTRCARDLDRYLRYGFNTTVVEFLGRGHEDFVDEQLRLFDWMGRFHRDFFPREFTVVTMRPWDNFFWWAECSGMPPASMVNPAEWPPSRDSHALTIKGAMLANNNLRLSAGTSQTTVWLSPQMIDFKHRVNILVGGRRLTNLGPLIRPSLETLLEDVRNRGDRQHPFWAKVEVPGR